MIAVNQVQVPEVFQFLSVSRVRVRVHVCSLGRNDDERTRKEKAGGGED